MATLDSMLERVWDEMPSVTESMALRSLADATKEFLSRTHYWRSLVDAIALDGPRYTLIPPAGTVVAAVLAVHAGERCLYPTAVLFRRPDSGYARQYAHWTPSLMELDVITADSVVVEAALTIEPGRVDVALPEDLIDEYAEALAAGAKMRLARMANQDWSLPSAAPVYASIFYAAISNAKRRATNALDQAELRVEMRTWT